MQKAEYQKQTFDKIGKITCSCHLDDAPTILSRYFQEPLEIQEHGLAEALFQAKALYRQQICTTVVNLSLQG